VNDLEPSAPARTLLARLIELRSRAVKAVLSWLAILICLAPFGSRIFELVAAPIQAKLPPDGRLIAQYVTGPFMTPLKTAFWASLFIAMPILLYHAWRYLELWLKGTGRRIAMPFLITSALLFYGGVAFAFFLVLPMAFGFFATAAPVGVTVMPDIKAYLDFTIAMLFAFGLAFQMPIAIVVLIWTGLVSRQAMAAARPYVFLGAFVVGAVLTPPDVFSQTLLAVPVYLLFEAALLFCRHFLPDRPSSDD
jgi:sec-independent protein translocase protein TatC